MKIERISSRARQLIPTLIMILLSLNLFLLSSCQSTYAEEYNQRGCTYYQSKDYQKAIASYQEAIRLKPDFAEAYVNLGVAYGTSGNYQKAIASCKEAIRLKPDFDEAHYNLGYAYFLSGDQSKALEECHILRGLDKELADELDNFINQK